MHWLPACTSVYLLSLPNEPAMHLLLCCLETHRVVVCCLLSLPAACLRSGLLPAMFRMLAC